MTLRINERIEAIRCVMKIMKETELFGVMLSNSSLRSILEIVEHSLKNNHKISVHFINAFNIVSARGDKSYQVALGKSSINLCDGMSIYYSAKIIGKRIIERISGNDFFESIMKLSESMGYRNYFLGTTLETLYRMEFLLREKYPALIQAGSYAPGQYPFSDEENRLIIQKINESKPDIVWVGISSPQQDIWIEENGTYLESSVIAGVGAVFNFQAGVVKRCPPWLQKLGAEWLFRLIMEPRRLWRRYLIGNTIFIYLVLKELAGKIISPGK